MPRISPDLGGLERGGRGKSVERAGPDRVVISLVIREERNGEEVRNGEKKIKKQSLKKIETERKRERRERQMREREGERERERERESG